MSLVTPALERSNMFDQVHTVGSDSEASLPATPDVKTSGIDAFAGIKPIQPTFRPSDEDIPDNYVTATISKQKYLPPVTWKNLFWNIQWISFLAITVTPTIALYGFFTTPLQRKTLIWSVIYYYITGLGITAGYHRLWAHRSYNASTPLQYGLAIAGSGAVQGSIKWWSRGHRAHHRYTDTKLDPYSAHEGFWWAHVGWMIIKPRGKIGVADVSDLTRNKVVRWQHKNYLSLLFIMGLILPTIVAGLGWGDWRGGFFFAGAARLVFVHHSTFCVNSLAHWLGDKPFDNKHTPCDHFFTALCTIGEGYHNFHHQFPMDFRNAIKWYQYDPTKWFIAAMSQLGLASHLKRFPDNEIRKGQYTMKLQQLQEQGDKLKWPKSSNELPVISWDDFQAEAKERSLIAIHGFIHDCSSFAEDHPGGAHLIKRAIGTDATTAFFGGVYDHSNAAHNLLAMMRVGILDGGMEVEHLKRRHADSVSSFTSAESGPSTPSLSSASSSSADLQSLLSDTDSLRLQKAAAPTGQPAAQVASKWTLAVPPSEKLRIIPTSPELRPGLIQRRSSITSLDMKTRADENGEISPMLGQE
ncbi:putative stearoyl-CoA 9-desaturase [Kockovaella imperatae]|uniref:stearoyl-CoA 9-desaturase n=1 Tax=Kockovaella imperatae TaxID=4999 RepID=A0A1Y1U7A5_9TREE|nr:putative stearoyl-CoA 9-desaturase [Kockovaella imperatae]ORX33913.1 putative stearoyl-CoA 9-desaturase [Kockovaella imperatae]